MTLVPITDSAEVDAAHRTLVEALTSGCKTYSRKVGWRGGHGEFTVYWRREHRFWAVFHERSPHHYSCACGTGDPEDSPGEVKMTCQMNTARGKINAQCQAMFLKDGDSGVYLARRPTIHGIKETEIRKRFNGPVQEISWPSGGTSEVVVLGKIGERSFLNGIADYLHAVEAIKAQVKDETPAPVAKKNPDWAFTPEFEGPKKKYNLTGEIEGVCDHGAVVKALQTVLESIGWQGFNNRNIDLFLANNAAKITHLFEIKTDQSTTNLYQAVGQLMLHGALENSDPQRIVVLPGDLSADTARRLKKLGIKVLRYEWKGGEPIFAGLKKVLT
jgi:hypothetical protein